MTDNTTATSTVPDRDRNADGRPENARPRDRFGAPLPRGASNELIDRVEPEDVCTSLEQTHAAAVELFDQQRFFEAHEFFEWAWKGPFTPDEERPFYKGLAQLAVGYTHTQRGNAKGAASLLQRGIDHVGPFGPIHAGVDVARAIEDARRFAETVEAVGPSPDLTFPRFPRG
ncbi:DUF309 domain-containing protein [Euzebya pacifica]|nr:DUF309 domain-containing protein [Euzebya pacifica]